MDPKQAKSIFLHAVEHVPPGEWPAYLAGACGDDAGLKHGVELLLSAHRENVDLADQARQACSDVLPTIDQPIQEKPGTQIGPYKLLQQIGEGGFGVVFMAEQIEPVRRRVALKVIKPGMDTRQVIARFEAERQALAVMDHPNIARVFDAGGTESGRPYFVMELVRGTPITQYCDESSLTIRERLELFAMVCQAIQHAHSKGIIHRDIKPTNVLVTRHDGQPVVKVIDFGVAKAMGQQLTEKTLFTEFAQMIGTPLYMSPEQAELSSTDIDTRSDIYSLGVLLYELLTGTTPVSKEQLKQAAFDEIRRIIREDEPQKPSTRISTAEAAPSIAAQRHTEPAKLTKLVRGELDWIVMKALEKDRNRRYETANGFAKDIEHYLNDEPVLACPPSAGYRLRKFARRNKGGLAVAALVLLFLVLLGSGVGWTVRDRAARQSRIGAQADMILREVDTLEKEQKWSEALVAAQRAEALTADGADAATQERVRQVLHALRMVAALDEVRLSETYTAGAEGRSTAHHPHLYAAAFRDFGVDVESLPAEESAVRLRARPAVAVALAAALDDWARAGRRRDPDQSKRLCSLAATVDPDPWRVSVRQASAATDVESLIKLASAPDTTRQPPQSQCLLASSLELCDRPDQALALLERASEIHPGDFWVHYQLASLNWRARPARLDAALRHAVAARALRPRSAGAWSNLGVVLLKQTKPDEAVAACRKATELDPKNARAYSFLGWVLTKQRKLDEALAACRKAIELDPKYASAYRNLGAALAEQKKWPEAIAAFRKVIEIEPNSKCAADAYFGIGKTPGKADERLDSIKQAVELDPTLVEAQNCLAWRLTNGWDVKLRDPQRALEAARKSVELAPQDPFPWKMLGWAHYRAGDWKASIEALEKSCALWSQEDPKGGDAYQWFFLAMANWKLGEKDMARQWYGRAVEWMDENAPNNEELRPFRAEAAEVLELKEKQ